MCTNCIELGVNVMIKHEVTDTLSNVMNRRCVVSNKFLNPNAEY